MQEDLVPIDPAMLALIHGSFDKGGALKPFAREIMLIECRVAGTSHYNVKDIEDNLKKGDTLPLQREPKNSFDSLAIKILDEAGHLIGYVPRVKNEALARLMDAGKLLFGKIENKYWQGDWLQIEARIYMRDF